MNELRNMTHQGTHFSVDWEADNWWQRLLLIGDESETAVIALQDVIQAGEHNDPFNYETDLVIVFAVGHTLQEALERLSDRGADPMTTISGVMSRRLGRLFATGPIRELIIATAHERNLSRIAFAIADDKPDTRYAQFAKQHGFALETNGSQRMWVLELQPEE